jgi:hypothetical protein
MVELFVGFLTGLCVYFIASKYFNRDEDNGPTTTDSTAAGGGSNQIKTPPKK